jgi:hypothetical protein
VAPVWGLRRFWVRNTGVRSGPAHEQHSLVALEAAQVLVGDVVFALALLEVHQRQVLGLDAAVDGGHEEMGSMSAEETKVIPRWPLKKPTIPDSYMSLGW